MKIKTTVVLLSLILFGLTKISAQNKLSSPFHSPDMRKKFGDFLFCQKDYLRSFYEYRSYLQKENNDTVRFKIALAFQRMKRYDESLTYFKGLFFNSAFQNRARNEFFKTLFLKDSLSFLEEISGNPFYQTEDSLNVPLKLSYSAALITGNGLPDSVSFARLFGNTHFKKMIDLYAERGKLEYKNSVTAAILSSVIPGAGKIYTENYGDGITAFLFCAVLGYTAFDNFRANHKFRAWLFSGLATYFYAGNIYGSYSAAQIFNATVKFDFVEKVKKFLDKENYFIPKFYLGCE